jgi:hypothetical protein
LEFSDGGPSKPGGRRFEVLPGAPNSGQVYSFEEARHVSANDHLTLAFDVLGRSLIHAERIRPQDFHALENVSVFSDVAFSQESFNELSGSFGFKVNLVDRLLLNANLLFALDDHGVRDKVTPMLALQYSF